MNDFLVEKEIVESFTKKLAESYDRIIGEHIRKIAGEDMPVLLTMDWLEKNLTIDWIGVDGAHLIKYRGAKVMSIKPTHITVSTVNETPNHPAQLNVVAKTEYHSYIGEVKVEVS